MDIATVGVASAVSVDGSGVCADACIALGAVAPTPLRAYAAEDMLKGRQLDLEVLQAAVDQAVSQSSPIDDVRGTARYRREMVGVLTRRTLERAVAAATGSPLAYEDHRKLAIQAAV
jgi:carbon-monoxide dehydrogenase medium subunit